MEGGTWKRLGLIGSVAGAAPWAVSHTALPVVEPAGGGGWDLYFSSRDADGRAQIGRCRMELSPSPALRDVGQEPLLAPGPLGTFDDRGVTMSCVVSEGGAKYLYYTGWNLGVTVPFYLQSGLAISEDGGITFRRVSRGPILNRDDVDPFLTASPCVLVENSVWRMWYVSGTGWRVVNGAPQHWYHIKYAESRDGIRWARRGHVCIDYESPDEYAFARPCVRRDGWVYRMWYAYRGPRYRIGYAESTDGMIWTRRDDAGLDASGDGWDADMVEYPWVFDWGGREYMLYNGNDYGRTGIGLAVWEPAGGVSK